MKNKIIRKLFLALSIALLAGMLASLKSVPVHAEEKKDSLEEFIEKTIDSDKEILNKLSPALKKIYDKIISAFKKLGTLSKDISRVVKMYEALDETAEDYPEKLEQFFTEYNKLGTVKRKVVDFCTGVLDAKDKLIDALHHLVFIDLYSEKTLDRTLDGSLTFSSDNEAVAKVDVSGTIKPASIGITSITLSNGKEQEIYRVFVKKPLLATKVYVKNGKSANITIPATYEITSVVEESEKISLVQNGHTLTVTGAKKGTAYIYVGTDEGKTLKYKVKVS